MLTADHGHTPAAQLTCPIAVLTKQAYTARHKQVHHVDATLCLQASQSVLLQIQTKSASMLPSQAADNMPKVD